MSLHSIIKMWYFTCIKCICIKAENEPLMKLYNPMSYTTSMEVFFVYTVNIYIVSICMTFDQPVSFLGIYMNTINLRIYIAYTQQRGMVSPRRK